MKFNWINIVIGLAVSVFSMFGIELPAPLMELLQKILEGLLQSPVASAAAVGGIGYAGWWAAKGVGTGSARAAAKRLRHGLTEARDAADDLGGVSADFTAALASADTAAAPIIEAALKKEKRKKPQPIPDE